MSGNDCLRLEQAEEQLQQSHAPDVMIDVDMTTLDLHVPQDSSPSPIASGRSKQRRDRNFG